MFFQNKIFKVVIDITNYTYLYASKGILLKIIKKNRDPNFEYNVTYFWIFSNKAFIAKSNTSRIKSNKNLL